MSDQRLVSSRRRDDHARLLHAAARERLAVAAADLTLPDGLRLSDRERTIVASLHSKLIRTIEDELRISLAASEVVRTNDALAAAFTSAHVEIAGPILERSAAETDRGLVSVLLRRTDEHLRLRARGAAEMPLLIELLQDSDGPTAEHAMAILIGHSRRYDSFSEPTAARTELSAELEHRLVWRVAAALRHYMILVQGADPAAADDAIVAAAERLLAGYDEGDSLEARAMRLARRLDETGRLSDELLERVIRQAPLSLFIAALAARTGLSHASTWEILSDPKGRGPVFLLKAAGVGRAEAAAILVSLAGSEETVTAQVDLFDVTELDVARQALRLWLADPGYRDAIAELSR